MLADVLGTGYLSGGGGIVIESDPEFEYLETRHKVEALLHILGHGRQGEPGPASPRRLVAAAEAARRLRGPGAVRREPRLVQLQHRQLPAHARRRGRGRSTSSSGPARRRGRGAARRDPLLVGPGPGDPWTAGRTLDWVAAALDGARPFLGVCLGHQALGVQRGARLRRAPRPCTARTISCVTQSRHACRRTDPAPFTRYNSLVLEEVPAVLTVEAWSHPDDGRRVPQPGGADGGLVMAIAHRERPAWGVQFHPESMLSPHGLDLLANFLETQ